MSKGRVVMGLLFFPRGGSAQVTRYLSIALGDAGWDVSLVAGSLGVAGEETHAPTFFGDTVLHYLDFTDAMREFEAGGSAVDAKVPMHPSYEDRDGAPDVLLAAVSPELGGRHTAVWEAPFRAAGADAVDVFHLHHLTPQHDTVEQQWPTTPVVAHLHGTEIKFLEEVERRAALAHSLGSSLADMADVAGTDFSASNLDEASRELLISTRWEQWRHGEFWRDRLLAQAARADHLVVVSPTDRATAVEILRTEPEYVTDVPNGVDVDRFCPRPMEPAERRAVFRRWLVEDPQGWDETGAPGSVAYRDDDLDALVGPEGDGTVLIYVGRFTHAKRVPSLVRAFARARPEFENPASLLIWGGHPGECETEHPVTVAREVGTEGIFFAGWRGHDDLPAALAACDALVMPSVNDSFPQTPLEAMAVGLPVLATLSGGFPFMVNVDPAQPTGWLFPAEDEPALVAALVEAVNQPADRLVRGRNALEYARRTLSWGSRVAGFENAYERARERRARRLL
ncbi:MAG TPA: glycosyltransferase family 4 protein [Acidimicrobiales bacterium]|nr:glycosyltransferase family 4 protein [Acidimicrobiales bacterium]